MKDSKPLPGWVLSWSSLICYSKYTLPTVGQRQQWWGEGCLYFLFLKKCLSFFFFFFLYCNSLCLTVSFLDLLMLVLPSAKSQLKCPLSKSYSSLSRRSTVSIVYLILFTTLTNWIISYLFISPNIMSTPREQWPWLSFTTICPYSLTHCLVHNNNNYVHISWTFKTADS